MVGLLTPPFYRGDVWENQIRRIRNRQNLYVFEVYGVVRGMSSEIAGSGKLHATR